MSSAEKIEVFKTEVKALIFDVFGTCVDWRSSVEEALKKEAEAKIQSDAFASLPEELQRRAKALTADDWAAFAAEWRAAYGEFTRSFVPGQTEWKDIDQHHHDSLVELLGKRQLDGLYTAEETLSLSRTWHFLKPWADSPAGIHKLGERFVTGTLSNGNQALLRDLDRHGGLGFQRFFSAEDFRAYKPNPKTYLGACAALGLQPGQVALVAAHLGDLAAARANGLHAVFVERPQEEAWKPDEARYQEARGWVDVWVDEADAGFLEVAKRLGIS